MPDQAPRLRLYIADSSPSSRPPLAELTMETGNVHQRPDRALADGVLMTPQLLILSEAGTVAVVGDLGDRAALLAAQAVAPP
ncbi:hypothetical protein ACVFYP_04135 [Roseomonas sp. F4]